MAKTNNLATLSQIATKLGISPAEVLQRLETTIESAEPIELGNKPTLGNSLRSALKFDKRPRPARQANKPQSALKAVQRVHSLDALARKSGIEGARAFVILAVTHRFLNPENRIHAETGRSYKTRWVDCVNEINPVLRSKYGLDSEQLRALTTAMTLSGEICGKPRKGGWSVGSPKLATTSVGSGGNKLLAALGL